MRCTYYSSVHYLCYWEGMERYITGFSYCDNMILNNFKNLQNMMQTVSQEPNLSEADIYLFDMIKRAFSEVDEKYVTVMSVSYGNTLTVRVDCDTLHEKLDVLQRTWWDRQEKFSTPGDHFNEQKCTLAFACVCFVEYSISLLQLVESACETENLQVPYIMVFLVVKEIVEAMVERLNSEEREFPIGGVCLSCLI